MRIADEFDFLDPLTELIERRPRARRSASRQELEEGSTECCRITTRRIMIEIRKGDLPSSRHALADPLIDQPVICMRFSPRVTRVGHVKAFSASHVMVGGRGAPNSSGAVRALSSNIVCVACGKRSNSPGPS